MSILPLVILPAGLFADAVVAVGDSQVIVTARPVGIPTTCPSCGLSSTRTHSRYERRLADLPWQGHQVELRIRVRRLRCVNDACPQRIFAERLPQIAFTRARHTGRLREIQQAIVMALGGKPGAHLAKRLALPISASTLLRVARATAAPVHDPPRVDGIDDWACVPDLV